MWSKQKKKSNSGICLQNDQRFNIRSVGLSPKSERQIKERDIEWTDLIFVMEQGQGVRIYGTYRHLELPEIEEDEYEYLEPELIEMLTDRINSTLGIIYKI
jgi:protein-tyrosine phosphatase